MRNKVQDIGGRSIDDWCNAVPVLTDVVACRETIWINPAMEPAAEALAQTHLTGDAIEDAAKRLQRFQPFIAKAFPETAKAGGSIESPLRPIPQMQLQLAARSSTPLPGSLFLKCDHQLPISGSVKARGGIYEVLKHAETLALRHKLISISDDYSLLTEKHARTLFGRHSLAVGSTGNLGLSIGIMGARFGFSVTVHMSADGRQWKKELLRAHGVNVVEHDSDYGEAVIAGRKQAANDPLCHFIDDENSTDLFLGYAAAAKRLAIQLDDCHIPVDEAHPLFVYLPCGVGGAPGGITFGLKHVFGDHVHCFFAEPTHAPCMLLGLCTGLHNRLRVQDFGIDTITAADGLAVGRPSGLVGRMMQPLIDGVFTVDDQEMFALLALLAETEGIFMEPSALAGLPGMVKILRSADYLHRSNLADSMGKATHIAWGTGGSMVPQKEMQVYYNTGKSYLAA